MIDTIFVDLGDTFRVIRKDEGKRTILYLCVDKWPDNGSITLEGNWKSRRATILQNGKPLAFRKGKESLVINVPAEAPEVTLAGTPVIIKLELSSILPVERLSTNSEKSVGNQGLDG